MATTTAYHPTPSQYAAARTHLETPIQYIRVDGIRYAIVTSGTSDRVYWLPADGSACDERCIWWEKTRTMCSHLLALHLQATLDELAEGVRPMADLYRRCARVGCTEICEGRICDQCAAIVERQERLAAARKRVLAEVMG